MRMLLGKTVIVALVLFAICCVFTEKASAQFFAGSYGAGFTPSPVALTDYSGRVTGSYNPNNGRVQGQGFVSPSASHYGYRNGTLALYVPMNYGLGGVTFSPRNRQHRRQNWRW